MLEKVEMPTEWQIPNDLQDDEVYEDGLENMIDGDVV